MYWRLDSYSLITDPPATAVDDTFKLLQETYWGHQRPLEVVRSALENSLCFFLLNGDIQIGFARVITDFATTSWLSDVVIADGHANRGLGSWMMKCVMKHPRIEDTQFKLQTGSAHAFYERLGFQRNDSLMSTSVNYL